jgi:hypothetical protein
MKHLFTEKIFKILEEFFGKDSEQVYNSSELLKYINQKTISSNKGSKARGNFGNLYAIYVLVEDYIQKGYSIKGNYSNYEGARFSDLFSRQRELPFGAKLQNHALNQRMNQEFRKMFPTCDFIPILRNVETQRYWINSNLLELRINRKKANISQAVIKIILAYAEAKMISFNSFISTCEKFKFIEKEQPEKIKNFINGLLDPNIDARIFEIVSYAILRAAFHEQTVFWGFTEDSIEEESLKLYKTGITNANDGGIDFVMKPLGRFFQVTETTDMKKYFLDIDKLEKFPITFVIKSIMSPEELLRKIREGAEKQYSIKAVVDKYVNCVEDIINIGKLKEALESIEVKGKMVEVLGEIIKQSKVEFNFNDDID